MAHHPSHAVPVNTRSRIRFPLDFKLLEFEFNVVRLTPSLLAAPRLPPITPLASLRMRRMCLRSAACRVSSGRVSSSNTGARSVDPWVSITALSMKFSNSLTLPGHALAHRMDIVSCGILLIFLFICLAYFPTKWPTSNGISVGRSRNGKRWMGVTIRSRYRSLLNFPSLTKAERSRLVEASRRTSSGLPPSPPDRPS